MLRCCVSRLAFGRATLSSCARDSDLALSLFSSFAHCRWRCHLYTVSAVIFLPVYLCRLLSLSLFLCLSSLFLPRLSPLVFAVCAIELLLDSYAEALYAVFAAYRASYADACLWLWLDLESTVE